ncbi:MAG: hypothetical protein Rhirs2KO_20360 [Rhizobiaceae bacterium]
MQQADGIGLGIVGAERVGTDKLGQSAGLVRFGAAHRAHFMQNDGYARLGDLPGGFRARKPAANNVYRICQSGIAYACAGRNATALAKGVAKGQLWPKCNCLDGTLRLGFGP